MNNDKKPDFSNVQGGVRSTEQVAPDFSNVQSKVTSTETITEGGGGGAGEQTYTVVKGDNLSKIAKHFYGKQDWKRIFDANRDQLEDPDRIQPGQVLKIPAAPEAD
ncbi:MAG: LysM peptidoglycan-binding domain-containing protein [Oxalobacteraceae bacterium]|nr:MAG: LysM peptidoglycan-binding domain-containing protein [Oxalobacteraceae bacterium]